MIKILIVLLFYKGRRTGMGDCSMVQVLAAQLWELDLRSSELTQRPVDMIVPCSSKLEDEERGSPEQACHWDWQYCEFWIYLRDSAPANEVEEY